MVIIKIVVLVVFSGIVFVSVAVVVTVVVFAEVYLCHNGGSCKPCSFSSVF